MTTTPPLPGPVEPPVLSQYAKAIVAIITAVLIVLVVALEDGTIDEVDIANAIIAFLTAFAVWVIPNVEDQVVAQWMKAIVAFIGAGLQALVPFLINGEVTNQQWLIVILAAIGALGVGVLPNVNPNWLKRRDEIMQPIAPDPVGPGVPPIAA